MSKVSIVVLASMLVVAGAASAFASIQPPIQVPEPATGVLLVSGLGACWAAFRRRKAK